MAGDHITFVDQWIIDYSLSNPDMFNLFRFLACICAMLVLVKMMKKGE